MNQSPQFYLPLEPILGSDIADVCEAAVYMASMLNVGAPFTFNGIRLVAWPDTDPLLLADKYRTTRSKKDA